jgi:hypothetical protein
MRPIVGAGCCASRRTPISATRASSGAPATAAGRTTASGSAPHLRRPRGDRTRPRRRCVGTKRGDGSVRSSRHRHAGRGWGHGLRSAHERKAGACSAHRNRHARAGKRMFRLAGEEPRNPARSGEARSSDRRHHAGHSGSVPTPVGLRRSPRRTRCRPAAHRGGLREGLRVRPAVPACHRLPGRRTGGEGRRAWPVAFMRCSAGASSASTRAAASATSAFRWKLRRFLSRRVHPAAAA